jgi:hypothetical protein
MIGYIIAACRVNESRPEAIRAVAVPALLLCLRRRYACAVAVFVLSLYLRRGRDCAVAASALSLGLRCRYIPSARIYLSQRYMGSSCPDPSWLTHPAWFSWHNPDPRTTKGDSLRYPHRSCTYIVTRRAGYK